MGIGFVVGAISGAAAGGILGAVGIGWAYRNNSYFGGWFAVLFGGFGAAFFGAMSGAIGGCVGGGVGRAFHRATVGAVTGALVGGLVEVIGLLTLETPHDEREFGSLLVYGISGVLGSATGGWVAVRLREWFTSPERVPTP
jgi:hypothetical protein